jgi:hypothetical protein
MRVSFCYRIRSGLESQARSKREHIRDRKASAPEIIFG